jgi:hypothetical protein
MILPAKGGEIANAEGTISMKAANRLAAGDRDQLFEGLAAFANMGETQGEFRKFRLKYRRFFPSTTIPVGGRIAEELILVPISISDWLYERADEWAERTKKFGPQVAEATTTPLLWYRDVLRAVWSRNDRTGAGLCVLYGLETRTKPADIPVEKKQVGLLPITLSYLDPSLRPTHGLPEGWPVINGNSGEINWEFPCEFQQAVFELMKWRRRAMICPECGRYFIADKNAQVYCSPACSGAAKIAHSLEYWNRIGSAKRKARSEKEKAE